MCGCTSASRSGSDSGASPASRAYSFQPAQEPALQSLKQETLREPKTWSYLSLSVKKYAQLYRRCSSRIQEEIFRDADNLPIRPREVRGWKPPHRWLQPLYLCSLNGSPYML